MRKSIISWKLIVFIWWYGLLYEFFTLICPDPTRCFKSCKCLLTENKELCLILDLIKSHDSLSRRYHPILDRIWHFLKFLWMEAFWNETWTECKFQSHCKLPNHCLNLFFPMLPDVVLVSLLLTLNRFHTLFWCVYCWLWTSKCQLEHICTPWKHQKT